MHSLEYADESIDNRSANAPSDEIQRGNQKGFPRTLRHAFTIFRFAHTHSKYKFE